jgi:hypothetical protein
MRLEVPPQINTPTSPVEQATDRVDWNGHIPRFELNSKHGAEPPAMPQDSVIAKVFSAGTDWESGTAPFPTIFRNRLIVESSLVELASDPAVRRRAQAMGGARGTTAVAALASQAVGDPAHRTEPVALRPLRTPQPAPLAARPADMLLAIGFSGYGLVSLASSRSCRRWPLGNREWVQG